MRGSRLLIAGGIAVLVVPFAANAHATPAHVHVSFTVPAHVDVSVSDDSWCDNKGPHITLNSTANVGGFAMELTFKNSVKGQKTLQTVGVGTLTLVSATGNTNPQIWKQPPLGGAGGNPFMYYQDPTGANFYIGRCVQDGKIGHLNHGRWSADFTVAGWSDAVVQAVSCSNKSSSLTIGTDSGTGGADGKLIFSNSDLGLNPQHINDSDVNASFTFSLINGNRIPKQGNLGGPGGNPLVNANFGTGTDVATFQPFDQNGGTDLGRCNKLG